MEAEYELGVGAIYAEGTSEISTLMKYHGIM